MKIVNGQKMIRVGGGYMMLEGYNSSKSLIENPESEGKLTFKDENSLSYSPTYLINGTHRQPKVKQNLINKFNKIKVEPKHSRNNSNMI